MSIASKLTTLNSNIDSARSTIVSMGGTVTDKELGGGTSTLATDIATIPAGGETYVTDLNASTSLYANGYIDVTSLANGIYHGKIKYISASPYVKEFYLLKAGSALSFITRGYNGSVRNYVNGNGLLYPNQSSNRFQDGAAYEIYKIADLTWNWEPTNNAPNPNPQEL